MSMSHHRGVASRIGIVAKVAAIAGVAALALSACSSSGGTSGSGTESSAAGSVAAGAYGDLTVQLSWIKNEEFAGEYFADSNGYYKDAGFNTVTLTPGPSTGAAELASGTADVALSDAVSIASAVANEDAPLKIIGATYQKNPFTILSLADKGNIKTPADLKGKKIGVQDSNTSLFKALLAANGLSESDVTIVPVQYDPSVLEKGEVDGFVAYLTNEAITVKNDGYDTVNLPFADNGLPFVAETITVTDDTIANDRDKLKAFLVAEIKGWTDNVNDPAAGAKLAVDTYGKDLKLDLASSTEGNESQVNDLVVSDETKANGLFSISDTLQDETITSLGRAGVTVTKDQLFDMSLLNEVYAEHPELKAYEK